MGCEQLQQAKQASILWRCPQLPQLHFSVRWWDIQLISQSYPLLPASSPALAFVDPARKDAPLSSSSPAAAPMFKSLTWQQVCQAASCEHLTVRALRKASKKDQYDESGSTHRPTWWLSCVCSPCCRDGTVGGLSVVLVQH